MRLTNVLDKGIRNLNKAYWNRRIWEIGYRGPPIATIKRPEEPLEERHVLSLQKRLQREYTVMRWLATPYLNKEQEMPFVEKYGTIVDEWKQEKGEELQSKMPNKEKQYKMDGRLENRRANVGNLLHNHRTVEESLKDLIRRDRWD